MEQIDLEKTVLTIFEKSRCSIWHAKYSHRLKFDDNGENNKVIVKFRKREDMVRAMNKNSPSKMLP